MDKPSIEWPWQRGADGVYMLRKDVLPRIALVKSREPRGLRVWFWNRISGLGHRLSYWAGWHLDELHHQENYYRDADGVLHWRQ